MVASRRQLEVRSCRSISKGLPLSVRNSPEERSYQTAHVPGRLIISRYFKLNKFKVCGIEQGWRAFLRGGGVVQIADNCRRRSFAYQQHISGYSTDIVAAGWPPLTLVLCKLSSSTVLLVLHYKNCQNAKIVSPGPADPSTSADHILRTADLVRILKTSDTLSQTFTVWGLDTGSSTHTHTDRRQLAIYMCGTVLQQHAHGLSRSVTVIRTFKLLQPHLSVPLEDKLHLFRFLLTVANVTLCCSLPVF